MDASREPKLCRNSRSEKPMPSAPPAYGYYEKRSKQSSVAALLSALELRSHPLVDRHRGNSGHNLDIGKPSKSTYLGPAEVE